MQIKIDEGFTVKAAISKRKHSRKGIFNRIFKLIRHVSNYAIIAKPENINLNWIN